MIICAGKGTIFIWNGRGLVVAKCEDGSPLAAPEPLGYGKEDVAEAVVGHEDFKVGRMGCGVLVSLVAVGG